MAEFPPLTHVALTVRDLRTSAPWYEALFGASPVIDEDTEPDMHHTVFMVGNQTLVGLHQHVHPAPEGAFSEYRVGCGGAPLSEVFGRVSIADKRRVVASDDRAVECGPNAFVGLRPGDDQVPYLALGEHGLEVGLLEGVAVPLVDHRLRLFLL